MEDHNNSNFMAAMDIFFIISPGHNFLYNITPSRLLLSRITCGRKGERGHPSYFKGYNPFKEWNGLFPRFKLYDWHFISVGGSLPVPFGVLCRYSRKRGLIYRYNFDRLRQQCARSPRWSANVCTDRRFLLLILCDLWCEYCFPHDPPDGELRRGTEKLCDHPTAKQ